MDVIGPDGAPMDMMDQPGSTRRVGIEAGKSIARRHADGFVAKYLSGAHILDIGYRGYVSDVHPIVPQAVGVELDYPGYDGRVLPFPDGSQDAVFSSHCLEHITDYAGILRDWLRVTRIGGYVIIMVPHQYLYEKRLGLPSRWNPDHKRFYTPASLLAEIESALAPNSYRVRHLADNDFSFEYKSGPAIHSYGCYEIELVIERIAPPGWTMEPAPATRAPGGLAAAMTGVAEAVPARWRRLLPAPLRRRVVRWVWPDPSG